MLLVVICLVFQRQALTNVEYNQTNPLVVLMNSLEVNQVSKINDIDIINTFVRKYGCVNQIHEIRLQGTLLYDAKLMHHHHRTPLS